MSGESVGPTMPLLTLKGYRRAGRAVWLGANPGNFTPQPHQFPAM
ncbi:hypothetical protein ABIB90_002165 [Bradyrhizobium sp. JR4.1]|nr:hypothetical protein Bra1253DRAFT_00967 [Bradyrhizobium sp. WSM1253]